MGQWEVYSSATPAEELPGKSAFGVCQKTRICLVLVGLGPVRDFSASADIVMAPLFVLFVVLLALSLN